VTRKKKVVVFVVREEDEKIERLKTLGKW